MWKVLVAIAIATGAVGAGVGYAGVIDVAADPRIEALDPVGYLDCPGGDREGTLHRGDIIYVTGRDDTGAWYEIRDPKDLGDRVWIAAVSVETEDPDGLSVRRCGDPVPTPGAPTASPADDSLVGDEDRDTPGPDSTPEEERTPRPDDDDDEDAEPTPTPATPSPTAVATDDEGPDIGPISAKPDEIWEDDPKTCPGQPTTSTVVVQVDDPSGVSSVELSWAVGDERGTEGMRSSGGTYTAEFGDLPPSTLSSSSSSTVLLTVEATDGEGNTETRQTKSALVLNNCS